MSAKRYKEITSGIYCIVNLIDGMMYIGSAVNLRKRQTEHMLALNKGRHPNRYLQAAWNKYWSISFEFKVLQIVTDLQNLVILEQEWMNWLNTIAPNGYNLKPLAASNLGMRHSEETKLKLSEAKKGIPLALETRAKMSETRKGSTQSAEWIAKRAEANRGRIKTQDEIDSIRANNRKFNKWPHADGYACKCQECRDLNNQMKRLTAANRRAEGGR